jgi:hypothetical protein
LTAQSRQYFKFPIRVAERRIAAPFDFADSQSNRRSIVQEPEQFIINRINLSPRIFFSFAHR